jgi:two-component system, NarL family, nitrate/nitrite response regulator NarL
MSALPVRLMLVDDHEMLAQSLRMILEQEDDIEVVAVANSVAAAVADAAAVQPDVILMDYYLPDGDGVSAIARIKQDHPDIKVVLLTGSDDPQALQRAVDVGCLGYLDKTAPLEELAAAVRVAASGHVVISAKDLAQLVPGRASGPAALTKREREVLHLVAEGLTNQAIAAELVLSVHTVRTHVQTILSKLGAHSKLEAVAVAKRRRLLR